MDPHSFFADPDPAVFLNVDPDPDPGGKMNADPCGSGYSLINFVKNKLMKFSLVVKYIKDNSQVRNNGALRKFTLKIE